MLLPHTCQIVSNIGSQDATHLQLSFYLSQNRLAFSMLTAIIQTEKDLYLGSDTI